MSAAPAFAQPQFYAGLGLEYGSTELSLGSTSGDLWMGSVIGGVRLNVSGNFFVGAEGETSLFTSYDGGGFGDDVDRISRLRGVAGYDFGTTSAFVAVGGVWVDGPLAGGAFADSNDGVTYGGGLNFELDERFDLRVEGIYDDVDVDNGTYDWDNTALRVGAVVKF
jgi:hypothetical protein